MMFLWTTSKYLGGWQVMNNHVGPIWNASFIGAADVANTQQLLMLLGVGN